jgi:hypothetical protein
MYGGMSAYSLANRFASTTRSFMSIFFLPLQMEGGKPLMAALKDRRSTRTFSPEPVTEEMLLDLLRGADGVN